MFQCGISENIKMLRKMKEIDGNTVDLFSLADCDFIAKCVEVYDGDTITVVICFDLTNKFLKFKVRLLGIDTPEIRTRDKLEKKRGFEARDYLRSLILNKLIYLKCGKFDKYGRLLGTVLSINDHKNINDLLIDGGYAEPYMV